MLTTLVIIGATLFLLRKAKKNIAGIGRVERVKRRLWRELETMQKDGVRFDDKEGYKGHEPILRKAALQAGLKDEGKRPVEQRYFNQLRRLYNSVAGTDLPYTESRIKNRLGDDIVIYRDYHLENLPKIACEEAAEEAMETMHLDSSRPAYWYTIAQIGLGNVKFVWKSNRDRTRRGVEELIFGHNAPSERKQRISYIATPEKGGVYPEQFAHRIWEAADMRGDTQVILDGVLQAIRETTSVGAARELCEHKFIIDHDVPDPEDFSEEVPF